MTYLSLAFVAALLVLTLVAVRMWYMQRGRAVSEAEQRVFRRFILGIALFWLVVVAGYFGGPFISGVR
jgi:hypothetical protein